ncbi:type III polyketide synthase [Jiella sonneratiae]|uniref:Type III polyketide synthase n=1 Tax=Jiella sonneratiae TaxID=2816856 RepID=A0ABS3J9B4_9HYPH|nr:type III polyketide synthase [Jiella sonneratiae]MBO0905725.1 type III polyketide synthase [Jiella sonneratiae]
MSRTVLERTPRDDPSRPFRGPVPGRLPGVARNGEPKAERSDAALPRILGLGTTVPPHRLSQTDVVSYAEEVFGGRFTDFERLRPVFENTGIEMRYSVQPIDWFYRPQNWQQRTDAYLDGATALFVDAATKALAAAELSPDAIDVVVTVSSTGIATPTLEARAHGKLGFRPDVRRVPLFGLGCAGGATGLALAARLAGAEPGAKVLLVVVETCTLAFRDDALTKSNIVATALFGDGAAALVLAAGGDGTGPKILASGEHLWPKTLDVMGWNVDPVGFGAVFATSIPTLVTERMRPAASAMLAKGGETLSDVEGYVFHPGGTKVVEALEPAFDLPENSLDVERRVLREFGNMSAPTVLFVLQRKLAAGLAGRTLLAALGPGFTGSFVRLDA